MSGTPCGHFAFLVDFVIVTHASHIFILFNIGFHMAELAQSQGIYVCQYSRNPVKKERDKGHKFCGNAALRSVSLRDDCIHGSGNACRKMLQQMSKTQKIVKKRARMLLIRQRNALPGLI